jgi:hypothetical protein
MKLIIPDIITATAVKTARVYVFITQLFIDDVPCRQQYEHSAWAKKNLFSSTGYWVKELWSNSSMTDRCSSVQHKLISLKCRLAAISCACYDWGIYISSHLWCNGICTWFQVAKTQMAMQVVDTTNVTRIYSSRDLAALFRLEASAMNIENSELIPSLKCTALVHRVVHSDKILSEILEGQSKRWIAKISRHEDAVEKNTDEDLSRIVFRSKHTEYVFQFFFCT